MTNHLQEDGSFINSIIGEGTVFRGNLELNGLLRIDGDFSGTIKTTGKVLIGINGRAECTINAGTVVVGGVVKGNIHAGEKVLVLSTGMMIGNINTPRLIAEEGVVLHGACLVQIGSEHAVTGSSNGDVSHDFEESVTRNGVESPEPDAPTGEQAVFSGTSDTELKSWNV